MLDTQLLTEQLRRTKLLKKAAQKLRFRQDIADFTVVSRFVGGKHYRCLFGQYEGMTYEPTNFGKVAEHFGCTEDEADILFGTEATLAQREMMIAAHIDELEEKIAYATTPAQEKVA